MNNRMLAVLLALPLVALGCGGKDEMACPFECRLQVRGAATEDLCCTVVAHDYSQDPYPTSEWVFMITAVRSNRVDEAVSVGVFMDGRPSLHTTYGWDGAVCSTVISAGMAERYTGSLLAQPPTLLMTHSADSLLGTGSLSFSFTEIPPASAVGEQSLRIHGTLTGTLPPETTGDPVTLSAAF